MSNIYYNYSGNFIPGTLARAESVSAEFSSVATGFSKLSIQGVDTGLANAYVVTTTGYPVAAYQDGNNVQFEAIHTNTGPSTINVNGLGPVPLLRFNGNALVSGDVVAGAWYTCIYTVLYGGFVIVSPTAYATFAGTISLAPPTNKVGLTASGGASTAAAPIDATWAIDQAIIPTWTGAHIFSGHALQVGAPTGGDIGAGKINVSGGFYVNNVLLAAGGVTSVAGTANQVTASPTSGAVVVSLPQNIIIPTPASGVALTVTGVSGASAAQFLTTGVQIGSPTGSDKGSGTLNVASNLYINNVAVVAGTGAGTTITGTANQITASAATGAVTLSLPKNVIIPTPTAGQALVVNGTSGSSDALAVNGSAVVGQSYGALISAGTNSSDSSFRVFNQAITHQYMAIVGDGSFGLGYNGTGYDITGSAAGNVAVAAPSSGVALTVTGVAGSSAAQFLTTGVQVGSPTGGDKGAGTINVASNFYINGTAISTGGVTSITGTANQIAASASTGAVTLSMPQNVIIPTPASGAALAVTQVSGSIAMTITQVGTTSSGTPGLQIAAPASNIACLSIAANGSTFGVGDLQLAQLQNLDARLVLTANAKLFLGTNGNDRVTIGAGGGVIVGAATDQGAGTLAALTQLYVGTTPVYRTGTFTGTFTGMTAGTTATLTYTIDGNSVTLFLGGVTGTSNATSMTMTGLPAVLQPASLTQVSAIPVVDNNLTVAGLALITAGSGTITFYRDILATGAFSATGFTNINSKGMGSAVITYLLL